MLRMDAPGVRWVLDPSGHDDEHLRHVLARARRRRRHLDLARYLSARVVGYLEVRWAQAARDARDALDLQQAHRL